MSADEHLLYAILPHSTEPRVLVLPDGDGWTLPRLSMDEWPSTCYPMFEHGMALREVAGCAAAALYSPYGQRRTDTTGCRFVFAMENCDPAFEPSEGGRWASAGDIEALSLAPEFVRPVLASWFRERETGEYPPYRPPWAFPGWEDAARAWIAGQVAAHGWRLTGPIALVRKWAITCVMKAPTDAGDLYFKAVPANFAREIAITRYLASLYPDIIPSIVSADEVQHWLLLRDFGQDSLGECTDAAVWERALRQYAALQIDAVGRIDDLLECGALDYRLETLPAKLDAMLADDVLLQPDRHLSADEIERIRGHAPRMKAAIDELGAFGLPPTIVHGDLHPWNIAVRAGSVLFFDWTDASVGHPFYDAALLFDVVTREVFRDQPEIMTRLRDAYLDGLSGLAPAEDLRRALALGELVGFIQQAANYRHLLQHVDPSEHWSLSFMTYLLKQALLRLEPPLDEQK